MAKLKITTLFYALNRQEPFEATTDESNPKIIDSSDEKLQRDLENNGTTFEKFAAHLIEFNLAEEME